LLLVAICSAFGASYVPMLPAIAREMLHQSSTGLGFLYCAVGLGALAGAYMLVCVPDRHLMLTPVLAALGFGVSLMAFSLSHWYALSFILLMPCAFCLMLLGGSTNAIIQLLARDEMRGRVVALYAMGFMGMVPWGSLILGGVAEHLGPGIAIAAGGTACFGAAIFSLGDRRHWTRMGVLAG
jgi:MFS family permease